LMDTYWTEARQRALDEIIDKYRSKRDPLIAMLQETQAAMGYIPEKAVARISEFLRIPPSRVYGVATFYTQFSFKPKGRHTILCCQGTACHVLGSAAVLEEMKKELNVNEGETTQDGRFTLEKVYCIGCCSLAPAMIVDDTAHGKLAPGKTKKILEQYS